MPDHDSGCLRQLRRGGEPRRPPRGRRPRRAGGARCRPGRGHPEPVRRPRRAGVAVTPELRREILADHARRRTGFAEPPSPGEWREARLRSPTCGDDLTVRVRIAGGQVVAVEWHGLGCEVSQASASMLAELVPGTRADGIGALAVRVAAVVQGPPGAEDPSLGDVEALAGVGRLPLRGRCALLAWNALRAAVDPG